jgi:signal transduction histidine kinase
VKAHEGRLDVKSTVGAGTTFTVTLRIHQPEMVSDADSIPVAEARQ